MLHIGKLNTLTVLRGTSVGFYLGDDEGNDVLLPHKYIPEDTSVGDSIDVFLYRDSEDRVIATTLTPSLGLHQFGCLQVKATSHFGAFLEWGLEKDLFVPFKEQNQKLKAGDWTVVYLYLDEQTDRLVASCRLHRFFKKETDALQVGQEVDILVYEKTDLGYNVVVNHTYKGLIYANEIFQRIGWGDTLKGYVKEIREEGKLDISLQPIGHLSIEPNAQKILHYLQKNQGKLALSDNSDPIEIQSMVEMSKKSFKKAVGTLYRQKKIRILPDNQGIELIVEETTS